MSSPQNSHIIFQETYLITNSKQCKSCFDGGVRAGVGTQPIGPQTIGPQTVGSQQLCACPRPKSVGAYCRLPHRGFPECRPSNCRLPAGVCLSATQIRCRAEIPQTLGSQEVRACPRPKSVAGAYCKLPHCRLPDCRPPGPSRCALVRDPNSLPGPTVGSQHYRLPDCRPPH